MSSDGQTVDLVIEKEECENCGTVRAADVSFLTDFYKNYYKLNTANTDPQYIYNNVAMFKSNMHYEWIESLAQQQINNATSIIEIGCGSGNLLNLFTIKNKYGVEPSQHAALHACKIASVRTCGYEDILNEEKYDIILSTCVIEHTIDPNDFLQKQWHLAHEGSTVIIGLPIQDTESFDVYFLDHLHHFTSQQFIQLCHKNGFIVNKFEIGYKCMTTIAYFILSKNSTKVNAISFQKNENFYTSNQWITNLNLFLNNNKHLQIVAFGYGETSFFYQTYTTLNSVVTCFIDDVQAGLKINGSKVITVSEAISSGILKNSYLVLLANPHYHEFLKNKFIGIKNLTFYSPFSNQITEY
jgi:SAM-dependent methyltransferase